MMDFMKWSEEGNSNNEETAGLPHLHTSTAAAAPTIKNHSVTHFNGYLYCFGGYDGRRNHMTLLLYSIAEQRWIRPITVDGGGGETTMNDMMNPNDPLLHHHHSDSITVRGTPPPGRNGHSATLAADSSSFGRIIIIGGWLGTGPLAASDMHILQVSGNSLQWIQPEQQGTPPGPCNMHSADYVPPQRSVYVFRGGNGREYLNDLHALNVDTLIWKRVETSGQIPQPRANHSSAYLQETNELFVFGGWNGGERLNDIHILDCDSHVWTRPRVGGVLPMPRAGCTFTALRGRLYLFGGSGTSAKCFQDLQILDRASMMWLDVCQQQDETDGQQQQQQTGAQGAAAPLDAAADPGVLRYPSPQGYHAQFMDPEFRFDGSPTAQQVDTAAAAAPVAFSAPEGGMLANDWRSRDWHALQLDNYSTTTSHLLPHAASAAASSMSSSAGGNDQDGANGVTVLMQGKCPGRRAGHTSTAVNRQIYVFGGSCGSDYLNDFFVLDTDPPPRARISEPASLQLVERRLRHFCNDSEFADVVFLVGENRQKVYGHKMVLSIVSDCFRAMFTTGFREANSQEIVIQDCSHAAFLAVMEYIYTGAVPQVDLSKTVQPQQQQQSLKSPQEQPQQDEVPLESSDNTASTTTTSPQQQDSAVSLVVEMLELADRFFLDHLKQICECLLQPAVQAHTVEWLLSVAQSTNAAQLVSVCQHHVRNNEAGTMAAPTPPLIMDEKMSPFA